MLPTALATLNTTTEADIKAQVKDLNALTDVLEESLTPAQQGRMTPSQIQMARRALLKIYDKLLALAALRSAKSKSSGKAPAAEAALQNEAERVRGAMDAINDIILATQNAVMQVHSRGSDSGKDDQDRKGAGDDQTSGTNTQTEGAWSPELQSFRDSATFQALETTIDLILQPSATKFDDNGNTAPKANGSKILMLLAAIESKVPAAGAQGTGG